MSFQSAKKKSDTSEPCQESLKERIIKLLDPRKDEVPLLTGIACAVVEFICTFLFVFYATAAVVIANFVGSTQNLIIAFTQGFALALSILIASTISGGYLNPAVTLAVLFVGRISLIRAILYLIAEFGGAIVASAILKAIIRGQFQGNLGATTVSPNISVAGAFFLELIMTFTLAFVLFATAIDPRGFSLIAPLAIGLVVLIDVLIALEWTGASMNPARTLGPQLVSGQWDHYWLYFSAPVAGATIAAVIYDLYLKIRPYEPPTHSKISGKKGPKDNSDKNTGKNNYPNGERNVEAD